MVIIQFRLNTLQLTIGENGQLTKKVEEKVQLSSSSPAKESLFKFYKVESQLVTVIINDY